MTPIINSIITKANENPIPAVITLSAITFAPLIIRAVAAYCHRPAPKPLPIILLPPPENPLLNMCLADWIAENPPGEKRVEAAARIREAYTKKSPSLDLSLLNLKTLPSCFMFLPFLHTIDCSYNPLTSEEPLLTLSLKKLNLNGCGLETLSSRLYETTSLQHLDLANNQLEELSNQISNLQNLKTLNVSGNKLTQLPNELGKIAFSLRALDCSGNQIKTLSGALLFLYPICTIWAFNNRGMTKTTIAPFLILHKHYKTPDTCPLVYLDSPLLEESIQTTKIPRSLIPKNYPFV